MKLLLYCTKDKNKLLVKVWKKIYKKLYKKIYEIFTKKEIAEQDTLNGKVVGECDFEIEKFSSTWYPVNDIDFRKEDIINDLKDNCPKEELEEELEQANLYFNLLENSCLTRKELRDYVRGTDWFYAIHIKNLKIFDTPKELSDFAHYIDEEHTSVITKAPQNMMYAYEIDGCFLKRNILISIRPEWLCKILNGEKTIEIRKKVLKELL